MAEDLPPNPAPEEPLTATPFGVRCGVYLGVVLALSAGWVILLRVLGYHGMHPTLVALVLAVITFLSTRSFLVDRFLHLPPGAEPPPPPTDNVRELLDLVVFVVVLVLLLKSFVAEAFQIPTGSMAETLYGNQKEVTCPSCSYLFPVNSSDEVDKKERLACCTCPNCLQRIHFNGTSKTPADSGILSIPDPTNSPGDRVLVAKFLYDLIPRPPARLDVVVFKFPGESNMKMVGGRPRFPGTGPYAEGTQMNYIKRLVGLPGEAIAIQRGKLYRLAPEQGLAFHDVAEANQLWRYKYMHECESRGNAADLPVYQPFWEQHRFEIIRKRPENILAMKRIVYDHDFTPRDLGASPGSPPRWKSESWKADGKGFRVMPGPADQTAWLRYTHVLRTETPGEQPGPELITDFMGYNAGVAVPEYGLPSFPPTRGQNWVGDLILEAEVEVYKPEGELVLELCKGIDRYQARWDLATGSCALVRLRGKGLNPVRTNLGSMPTTVKGLGTFHLRFADVDERLTVWVDRDLPFGDGVPVTDPYRGGPLPTNDLHPAGIGAVNADVTARSLKLFRDTYYIAGSSKGDVPVGSWGPSKSGLEDRAWQQTLDALDEKNMPVLFLYVQPDHYLCLGDNSPNSSDGRTWGLVPNRLLLGRALLVFYPFNRLERID